MANSLAELYQMNTYFE